MRTWKLWQILENPYFCAPTSYHDMELRYERSVARVSYLQRAIPGILPVDLQDTGVPLFSDVCFLHSSSVKQILVLPLRKDGGDGTAPRSGNALHCRMSSGALQVMVANAAAGQELNAHIISYIYRDLISETKSNTDLFIVPTIYCRRKRYLPYISQSMLYPILHVPSPYDARSTYYSLAR